MSEIVCQVSNQPGQVEFIWSSHGGFFRPYGISGQQLTELRRAADRCATDPAPSEKPSCREALETLVFTLNQAGAGPLPWEPPYELAEAGFRLFNCLLPPEDETARKVRRWLEDLRKQSGLIGLEVVVEERSADAATFLSVPWNLVYDERPAKYKDMFHKGQEVERWRPFWSVRYNLTSGRRVEPLKRMPLWSNPRVVIVVDPTVHRSLSDDQRKRLEQFLAEAGLTAVGSMDELEAALEQGYPRLLYWLGHATPEYLMLGDERIAPSDLRNLLRSFDDRERPEGMLAFLNACQTAETGSGGSFLDVLHSFGFTGAIATERQTIDNFANEFGLSFLKGFLREGKPLGELLHGLRLKSAPLGLLYGAHCPSEIRVQLPGEAAENKALLPIQEHAPVSGTTLGVATLPAVGRHPRTERTRTAPRPTATAPALPEEPYRSLGYYDWKDRALFTGRDADVVRFAASLDRPDTRILILHGESGTGKSSFLRAGVIPYLEQECVGYKFLRRPDGSLLFIQPAKDLVGQAAQTLLDATARTICYKTPEGGDETVNLRELVDEAVGAPADFAGLRAALLCDAQLFAKILARIADRLPYALVLVFDQIEEVFTLAKAPDEVAGRDHALRMIQRVVDVQADVKLIISLRTEYYGRLLDHLRAGRRDLTGVRDDLLRDFSRTAVIEAITQPTSETPLAEGQPSPRAKYGFHYDKGIPEAIADGVMALRSENQDSVLPLVQVICTQLYERARKQSGSDVLISRNDLDAIKGVEGGLQAFAEDALVRSLRLGPEDRDAFKALFSQLYNRQPDGTLTTWLMPRKSLEDQWDRPTPFVDLLEAAKSVRLLREDELRIEGGEPRRYVRLGHDALAKVAAAWKAENEEKQRLENERSKRRKQFRRLLVGKLVIASLALLFAVIGLYVSHQNRRLGAANRDLETARAKAKSEADHARLAEVEAIREAHNARASANEAKRQETVARARLAGSLLARVENIWASAPRTARSLLLDESNFRPSERDFAWRYYARLCHQARPLLGHRAPMRSVAFSPDGKTLVSASDDHLVRWWDVLTGKQLAAQGGHLGPVNCVAYSPDGTETASGSDDKLIRVRDSAVGGWARVVLRGHDGPVRSVAFSPNGEAIVSASADQTIRLWDRATGKLRATFRGHTAAVNSLAFSSDSKAIASASADQTVRLWDASTNHCRATLHGHTGLVQSLAFSPDARVVVSGGEDQTVRLWDAATGECRATLRGHEGPVSAVGFSPDGTVIASASVDRTIRLWHQASGELRTTLHGQAGPILAVAFRPDGLVLASSSADGTVHFWNVSGDGPGSTLPMAEEIRMVRSVAFSPDGTTIASSGDDWTVRLWGPATGQQRGALYGHLGPVICLAYDSITKVIASGGGDQTVRLWDASTGKCRATLHGHEGPVRSVAFSPDGSAVASASTDQTIRLWDRATGKLRHTLRGHTAPVNAVAFSSDTNTIATASADQTMRLWDVKTGNCRATLHGHTASVSSLAFSPDSTTIASGGDDHTVRLWSASKGHPLARLNGHGAGVSSVVYHPGGATIASQSRDGIVRLWDVATGRSRSIYRESAGQLVLAFSPDGKTLASCGSNAIMLFNVDNSSPFVLRGDGGALSTLAFSPNGKIIASGGEDQKVRLWDAIKHRLDTTLSGHTGQVNSVAFSDNGNVLASGSTDQTVRIWDSATGECRATLRGHEGPEYSVAFSRDGTSIASGGGDGTVRLWNAATGQPHLTLTGHTKYVFTVAFSPDGTSIASGGADGSVRLWDATTGHSRGTHHEHKSLVNSVAFSPDGTLIASSSGDIRLWNVVTGESRVTLSRQAGFRLAFSPDGRTLASAIGSMVQLVDVATDELRATLGGHEAPIGQVAFNPDGTTLASCSQDGAIRIWDATPSQTHVALPDPRNPSIR